MVTKNEVFQFGLVLKKIWDKHLPALIAGTSLESSHFVQKLALHEPLRVRAFKLILYMNLLHCEVCLFIDVKLD